ncbi:E3 ubiquitin-protein ligase RNF19A isoform 1 [Schistosoma japonicum]|uniref:RBR-type E3 ubiquitin transferase n=2 Tax=Schistosoma japonicum TaxID=6182 RepID=C1LJD5_SCHJA|nr:E3 ubiquitin-protein ligase [Schistosoma japonicum]KAH8851962.1 E3 ubiquitin-protein ligase [Schistosoma japonicum]TNN11742.1 E3 ubiquitin-protein ligase RNF19A isoform 1 [Schistosoma japonicum]CAX74811.1 E3 ubiquitin-protein ligase RNF19 [Schistosoma japonicum]CAX74813.1 E3 ubiquitin-protein ligase RNF19 [Schistosoma japonicum]
MSSNSPSGNKDSRIGLWFKRILPDSRSQVKKCNELTSFSENEIECPVCLMPTEDPLQLNSCGHFACSVCWRNFISSQIENFALAHLTCVACSELLQPSTIIHLLSAVADRHESLHSPVKENQYARSLARYEEFLLQQVMSREPEARWCPRGCGYGLIAHSFQACPQIVCLHPECEGRSFCFKCKRPWSTDIKNGSSSHQNNVVHICPVEQDIRSNTLDGLRAFFGIRRFSRQISGQNSKAHGPQQKVPDTVLPIHLSTSTPKKEKRPRVSKSFPTSGDYASDTRLSMEELFPDADLENANNAAHALEKKRPVSNTDMANSSESAPKTNKRRSVDSDGQVKPCPNCKTLIQKLNDGSCNSMVCSICNYEFCWLCLREITATHYLNFSGCTVLGRSRWSKLRRFVAVCGIILGTPIILPLTIVIALPALSIGFTVSITKPINRVFLSKSKHLRRFVVFWVVIAGLILFPILTALTFGVLIPIVLGYVYLYLPISLLRSLIRDESEVLSESTELEKLQSVTQTFVDEFEAKNDVKLNDGNLNESKIIIVNETISIESDQTP